MSSLSPGVSDSYIIIAAVDADLSQADIDANYFPGVTDLAPDKLPLWLYVTFGDSVNFIV